IYVLAGGGVLGDAKGIISELAHLAGSKHVFSDQDLADAARKSKYDAQIQNYVHDRDNVYNMPRSERSEGFYGVYFHYLQFNNCNTQPGNVWKFGGGWSP